MARKHVYTIKFNKGSKAKEFIYKFGNVRNISIRISSQRATVLFVSGAEYSPEDLVAFKSKLFRDAYRKVYLLHALLMNQGLAVNSIEVTIDGITCYYDKTTPFFPFMFSLIERKPLGLSNEWKLLIPEALSTPKSTMDKDLRFVSAFSYLSSRKKRYEVEQFTNLWTAMNAYYSYIAQQFEYSLRRELGIGNKEGALHNDLSIQRIDSRSIGALCWILCSEKYRVITRKEADALWKDNYRTESLICNLNENQIQELYAASKAELGGTPLPPEYKELSQCAELFGLPLFNYLLLTFPYHWRCNLFHGNRATILFTAYNDYEVRVLHTVNYFLSRFLNEEIPKMFEDTFFEPNYEKMKAFMRLKTQKSIGSNGFDNQFLKIRNAR